MKKILGKSSWMCRSGERVPPARAVRVLYIHVVHERTHELRARDGFNVEGEVFQAGDRDRLAIVAEEEIREERRQSTVFSS